MKVIVYDKNTKKGGFNNYGYGKLRLLKKCEITEELNGRYDLELIIDREDPKAHYIKKWALISVDGEIFRVVDKFDNDFDLVSGRYVIDAKSIMGIFSLDLSKPISLNVHASENIDEILKILAPYII